MYCRRCGCRASTKGARFIQKLCHCCVPPGNYGIDNLKKLSSGKLPRSVSQWPLFRIEDDNGNLDNRVVSMLRDHPELSVAECKLVANMLLKCAEFANRRGDKSL